MTEAMMLKENELQSFEERKKYTITVVGCGRMGLSTACLLSNAGFNVICLDSDPYIISHIIKGTSPFAEHGLSQVLKQSLKENRISATTEFKESISKSDIIIVAVNISVNEKKHPDYTNIEVSCKNIGINMKRGSLIIIESTLGPTITETLIKETLESSSGLKAGLDFGLAYSPIRATVGRTLRDMTEYSRVVAGINKQSAKAAKAVLKTIVKGELVEVTNFRTAEATKIFENIYRDVNISLANEFAIYCEMAGIDYFQAQKAANTQPFCHLLKPGIVSGHMPKDSFLLIDEAMDIGLKLRMPLLARSINDNMVKHAFNLVKSALRSCDKPVRRSRISVMGISYRPNVKEMRDSLVPELINILKRMGAKVNVFDPYFTYKELRNLGYDAEPSFDKTVEGADCILIAVGHNKFKRLSLARISAVMKKPSAIVDLAHIVNPARAMKEGFIYRGLGRGVWKK
ncbi:nucleotide sugar dehydrogenase [Candidatus Bathyarchaeota archaeon]|nr:nucleotide sugar dehydrogenase [Candidatus Bathyarchaeota archaeon]